jgi:hypothetical protein
MLLEIVIPSKGRIKKLEQCINSIFHSAEKIPITLTLSFSVQKEFDYFQQLLGNMPNVNLELLTTYRVPEFWNNALRRTTANALCYLNDDILLFDDTLEVAMKEFQRLFPTYDGVLGLRQANLPESQAVEGAFGIIGKKYTERFPDGMVWVPQYDRFYADFELWQYAKYINKFNFCTTARIIHLHPAFSDANIDETHKDVRKYFKTDKEKYEKRKQLGYLWGKDFNLLD